MKIVRVAVVSVALVLLNGCANYWLKPGATKQSFNSDKAQCMAQAYLTAPITNTPAHLGSGYTTLSSATRIDFGNIVNCTSDPGTYVPPTVVSVDMNTHARTAMVDACMRGLGYTKVNLGIGGGAATITQAPLVGSGNMSEENLQQIPGECAGLDDRAR
jgi:hypothetical protein